MTRNAGAGKELVGGGERRAFRLGFRTKHRPRGVDDDEDAAGGHGHGGGEGVEDAGHRQRDGDDVVGECPAEVLADAAAGDGDEVEGVDDALEALAGDDDVGSFGRQRGGRAKWEIKVPESIYF